MKLPLRTILKTTGLSLAFAGAVVPQSARAPVIDQQKIYAELLRRMPQAVGNLASAKPDLPYEIEHSYKYLQLTCPALRQLDLTSAWNISNWLNENVTQPEWEASPYNFRRGAYRATAVQKLSDVKTEMITRLQPLLPDQPAFALWIDRAKKRIHDAVQSDSYLNHEKAEWNDVINDDQRLTKYLDHISDIVLHAFFSATKNPPPKSLIGHDETVWRNGSQISYARYVWSQNAVNYNFSSIGIKTAAEADAVGIHETTHMVQGIIKNWYLQSGRKPDPTFEDAGEKYFYNGHKELGYYAAGDEGYRRSFFERMAYYMMNAANPEPAYITADPAWIKTATAPDNQFDNPDRGSIPGACFK